MLTLIFKSGKQLLVNPGRYVLVSKQIENVQVNETLVLETNGEALYHPLECTTEVLVRVDRNVSILVNREYICHKDAEVEVRMPSGMVNTQYRARDLSIGDRLIRDGRDIEVFSLERY